MGGEASSLVPKPLGFDYMSITFRMTDRIRLLYADDREISAVREALMQHWPKGIQEESSKFGAAHEFKLRGNPFTIATSAETAIQCRKLGCNILYRLYNIGCKLLISSDLAQTSDLTTWFFHREQIEPSQFEIACIGVSSTDKLQFVNFPAAITQTFQSIVQSAWPQEIQKVKYISDVLEIKLRGNPWSSCGGSENIQSKTLIKAIINDLSIKQWGLYGNGNLKSTADTLFFRYDPAQPVDGSLATGFVISLNRDDRLRCIDAPADVSQHVKQAIVENWHRGLQNEKMKFNSVEYKLAGNPWWAVGTEAIDSRLLICKILEKLMTIGWKVQLGIDLSRKVNDKSILTFQRCAPMAAQIFCLSLNETDKVRFINAPQNVINTLRAEVARTWLFGISRERMDQGCFELKLNKNPWTYGMNGHDGAHGRIMLSYLLKACAQMGWYVILSADVSAKYIHQEHGPDYPIDVHSMWFLYLGFGATPDPALASAPPLPPPQFGNTSSLSGTGFAPAFQPGTGFAPAYQPGTGFAPDQPGAGFAPATQPTTGFIPTTSAFTYGPPP